MIQGKLPGAWAGGSRRNQGRSQRGGLRAIIPWAGAGGSRRNRRCSQRGGREDYSVQSEDQGVIEDADKGEE